MNKIIATFGYITNLTQKKKKKKKPSPQPGKQKPPNHQQNTTPQKIDL